MEKDHTLFGTKIQNNETNEIGLLIYTWTNSFHTNSGKTEKVQFATCVDANGKKYNIAMDNITPF